MSRSPAWTSVTPLTPEDVLDRLGEEYEFPRIVGSADVIRSVDSACYSLELFTADLKEYDACFETAAGRAAAAIIYDILRYLSKYPFPALVPQGDRLSRLEISRALFWLFVGDAGLGLSSQSRPRSSADQRRMIFQSLAVQSAGEAFEFDFEAWRRLAGQSSIDGVDEAWLDEARARPNRDEDGDELFYDVLDTLFAVQPLDDPPFINCTLREDFRPLAKRLHNTDALLHQLEIPSHRFRALLDLLIPLQWEIYDEEGNSRRAEHYRSEPARTESVNAVMKAFSFTDEGGIMWPEFNYALKHVTPHLIDPLYRALNNAFGGGDSSYNWSDHQEAPPTTTVANASVVDQLGIILSANAMSNFSCVQEWPASHRPDAGVLVERLNKIERLWILLVAGKSAQGEHYVSAATMNTPRPWLHLRESKAGLLISVQLRPKQSVLLSSSNKIELVGHDIHFGDQQGDQTFCLKNGLQTCQQIKLPQGVGRETILPKGKLPRSITEFKIENIELWVEQVY